MQVQIMKLMELMTTSNKERVSLNAFKGIGSGLIGMVMSAVTMPMILKFGNGSAASARGYFMSAVVFSIVSIPCFLVCFASTKEIIGAQESDKKTIGQTMKELLYSFKYTLSDRKSSIYTYMNYQKGSNYFIDINLFNYDGADNEFSEKLKQEKITELEAEVEKIKNLVYKNPDNFYILNYSIEISTVYDNSLMQNMTYCSTIGNSYEMTVHDFEENVEPIIIKRNREQNEGEISTYIYDLKDVLKI